MNVSDRNFRWPALREWCLATALTVGMLHSPIAGAEAPQAGEPAAPAETPTLEQTPAAVPEPSISERPVEVDPSITLKGAVWRTKSGIVFLKTPVGLLTLSSKTTLKDLKASQEVRFWLHERHSLVEIRRRTDGSLVHRYYSGPMTSGTDASRTLRWRGPDGE